MLAPSAFKKNAKRNEERGRPLTEPEFAELDLSAPPGDLSPAACDFWLELAPHMVGIVKVTDALMLGELCTMYAELREHQQELASEGYTRVGRDGVTMNPRVKQVNALRAQIITLSGHFGLTPSTRPKLGGPEKPQEKQAFADV